MWWSAFAGIRWLLHVPSASLPYLPLQIPFKSAVWEVLFFIPCTPLRLPRGTPLLTFPESSSKIAFLQLDSLSFWDIGVLSPNFCWKKSTKPFDNNNLWYCWIQWQLCSRAKRLRKQVCLLARKPMMKQKRSIKIWRTWLAMTSTRNDLSDCEETHLR